MRFKTFAAAAALTFAAGFAFATDSTPGARAYFINLTNGQHVKSPVLIQFGLSGMGIAPAGSTNPGTGHHHLIIDAETPGAGAPISMDDKHMHFWALADGGFATAGAGEPCPAAGSRGWRPHPIYAAGGVGQSDRDG